MLKSIQFQVWSPEQIRKESVVAITEPQIYKDNAVVRNGLRDPRMGLVSRRGLCETCGLNWKKCPGHFGHLDLPLFLFHPGWTRELVNWCNMTCRECHRVSPPNRNVSKKCFYCKKAMSRITLKEHVKLSIKSEALTAKQVYDWVKDISKEDLNAHGRNPERFHPSWLVLQVLPIPPSSVRPSPTVNDEALRSEDPLTKKMLVILRVCAAYSNNLKKNAPKKAMDQIALRLQDVVTQYIDHSKFKGYQKAATTSICDRIKGKGGRVRGNLMGKRVNYSARSVVSGDAALGMNELGVPHEVANQLTKKETVTNFNIAYLEKLMKDKKVHYVTKKGAGNRSIDVRYAKRKLLLRPGDVVERVLQDGDIVLFNRQPSLHRMSIMAHRVVRTRGKTFRLNLSCTTPYNADFDGDEMNLHVPQTLEACAEAMELLSVEKNILTPQSHKPVMSLVQDGLLGAYLITDPKVKIDKALMCNLCMIADCPLPELEPCKTYYTGLQAISMLLPKDCSWSTHIWGGKMISGRANKKMLGRSDGSLIHVIHNDYGPDRCVKFINDLQRIVVEWMRTQGFSLGIQEMVQSEETKQKITEAYEESLKYVDDLIKEDLEEAEFEQKVNAHLNQIRDTMGNIAAETINPENRLLQMVKGGSKGSMINILQSMTCVGQQNCQGKRIEPTMDGRTLALFEKGDKRAAARGFVRNSYMDGLNMSEFFFHAIGGREGLIDTAVKTANTGYITRRLVKACEALQVAWDGTVRDQKGRVYQFKYGDDGYDPTVCEMVAWPKHLAKETQKFVDTLQNPDKWPCPLPVDRTIRRYEAHQRYGEDLCTEEHLLKECSGLIKKAFTKNFALGEYLAAVFDSRNFLETHPDVNVHTLRKVVLEMEKRMDRADVAAGENVGTIAAQSVGEATMQLTLDTFHNAGVAAKNVTLGVPRMNELMNASKNPSTPITTIKMDKKISKDPYAVFESSFGIEYIIFKDLVAKTDIVEDADRSLHASELQWYRMMPDAPLVSNCKWVWSCELDDKKMIQHNLTIECVVSALRDKLQKTMEFEYAGMIIHGRFKTFADKPDRLYHKIQKQVIYPLYISGLKKIKACSLERTIKDEFYIVTEGTDLANLITMKNIDFRKIVSNHPFDVLETLGIEAARQVLFEELRKVISFDGTYIQNRNIMVQVDWMTWGGDIQPTTRHGVSSRDHATPMKRCTFEQPVEVFYKAAFENEEDPLEGISEQLISGVVPTVGTCYGDVIVPETKSVEYPDSPEMKPRGPPPPPIGHMKRSIPWAPPQMKRMPQWSLGPPSRRPAMPPPPPQTRSWSIPRPQNTSWSIPAPQAARGGWSLPPPQRSNARFDSVSFGYK